jgi:hypothetical protein
MLGEQPGPHAAPGRFQKPLGILTVDIPDAALR